jgi:hypothetical protein
MEPDALLLCSQEPATGPYPEPHESSPQPHNHFFKIHSKIILHLRLGLPKGLFSSGLPTKILTCVLHALPISAFLIWSP